MDNGNQQSQGLVMILVLIVLTTLVSVGLVYLELSQIGYRNVYARQAGWQALYLAETAAEEGWWYCRNISPNFTGTSGLRALGSGEYEFEVISSRNVLGTGYIYSKENPLVTQTVSLNSELPLVYAATPNISGFNVALWLGEGPPLSTFDWSPTLAVRGGDVFISRNVTFRGEGDKIIDRTIYVFGDGSVLTANESNWTGGRPVSANVATFKPFIMTHNYDLLYEATPATQRFNGDQFFSGTTLNPIDFSGLVYISSGTLRIGGVYSGNMTIVAGPLFPAPGEEIRITGDLTPLREKDSLTLITRDDFEIERPTLNIHAILSAENSFNVVGNNNPGTVNIIGALAISGRSDDSPLKLPSGANNLVSINIDYDPRLFTPTFNNELGVPNMATAYWGIY